MRIVIDLQGAQTESRFRGIGRYSVSIAVAIIRNNSQHEVFIALSAMLGESIADVKAQFADLLPAENIVIWHAAGPVRAMDRGNEWRRESAELMREAFLEGYARMSFSSPACLKGTSMMPSHPCISLAVAIKWRFCTTI